MNFPRFRLALLLLLAVTLLPAADADAASRRFITIGTGGVTGVYYPAGGAICRMINQGRREHGIRCNVEATGGSVYNANQLAAGELDLGIVQSDVGYKAWSGEEPFTQPNPNLRALFSLHSETLTLVARQDAGINQLRDIIGKRVNIGNPGSGQERTAGELLAACGIDRAQLAKAGTLKASEMPDALRDGKLDAYFYVVGHPTANIKDAATGTPVKIIPITDMCAFNLVKDRPYYVHADVPGGLYPGVEHPVRTFGVKATVLATADLPDEAAYAIVRTVFEGLESFRKLHPAFRYLRPQEMLEGMTAPFHPGAVKYFQEAGLM